MPAPLRRSLVDLPIGLAALAWGFAAVVLTATPGHSGETDLETPLPADPGLTLTAVLDRVVERDLGSEVASALGEEAAAREALAKRWLPGGTSLQASLVDDGAFAEDGYRQWDAALQIPLWWPGQRRGHRGIADSTRTTASVSEKVHRLEVAGWLRSALVNLALSEVELALWRAEVHAQDELLARVSRGVELGEFATRDLLLARTARLEAVESLLRAEESVHHTAALYRELTGLDHQPSDWREMPNESRRIDGHPRWIAEQAKVKAAEAEVLVARANVWPAPVALLGTQHEGDRAGSDFSHRIVAGLTMPIGRQRGADVQIARVNVAAAKVRRAASRLGRTLRLDVDRAWHEHDLSVASLETAGARVEISSEHLRLTERAFELGELDLSELILARVRAIGAARNRESAAIRVAAAASAVNQALGIVP